MEGALKSLVIVLNWYEYDLQSELLHGKTVPCSLNIFIPLKLCVLQSYRIGMYILHLLKIFVTCWLPFPPSLRLNVSVFNPLVLGYNPPISTDIWSTYTELGPGTRSCTLKLIIHLLQYCQYYEILSTLISIDICSSDAKLGPPDLVL